MRVVTRNRVMLGYNLDSDFDRCPAVNGAAGTLGLLATDPKDEIGGACVKLVSVQATQDVNNLRQVLHVRMSVTT